MILLRRHVLQLAAMAVAFNTSSPLASAQTYPSRPITMIVPFPPGGPVDVIARIVSERMKVSLGTPIIIENVSGANGSIGVGRTARAAPDGYTIDLGQLGTHVMNGAFYTLSYNLSEGFEPIVPLVTTPVLLYARKTMPGNDLKEMVAWLKANPDKATHGTTTTGMQALGALFQKETGTQFRFIPYRGEAPAVQDLIGAQIDLLLGSANNLAQVRAGSIKAYAVTSKTHLTAAPDIPTAEEAGLPELNYSAWYGLFAPKGTPEKFISTLNAAAVDALADPMVRQQLTAVGLDIFPHDQQTPEALGALVKNGIDKWWPIIKAANIKAE